MQDAGSALMGIGVASGENRAVLAAQQAIESPLLEVSIDGARGVLFNVAGGMNISMHEINEAAEVITTAVSSDANIIFGATIDESLGDKMAITVIATGFDPNYFGSRSGSKTEIVTMDDDQVSSSDNPIHVIEDVRTEEASMDEDHSGKHKHSVEASLDDDDSQVKSMFDDQDEHDTPAFWRRLRGKKDD